MIKELFLWKGSFVVDGLNDSAGPIAIPDVGRMNHDTHQQAGSVDHDMASRVGEYHPHALLDPYVSLSAISALVRGLLAAASVSGSSSAAGP